METGILSGLFMVLNIVIMEGSPITSKFGMSRSMFACLITVSVVGEEVKISVEYDRKKKALLHVLLFSVSQK